MIKKNLFFIMIFSFGTTTLSFAQEKIKLPLEEKILQSSPVYLQKVATILVLLTHQSPETSEKIILQAEKDEDSPERIILRAKTEENDSVRPIEKKESLSSAHRNVLKLLKNNEKTLYNVNTLYKKIIKKLKHEAAHSAVQWNTLLFGADKGQKFPSHLAIATNGSSR